MFDYDKKYYDPYKIQEAIDKLDDIAKIQKFHHIKGKKFDMLFCNSMDDDVFYNGYILDKISESHFILNTFSKFFIIKVYSNPEEIFLIIDTYSPSSLSYPKNNMSVNRLDEINMDMYPLFSREEIHDEYLQFFNKIEKMLNLFFNDICFTKFYFENIHYGYYNSIMNEDFNNDNFIKFVKLTFTIDTKISRSFDNQYIFAIKIYTNLNTNKNKIKIEEYTYNQTDFVQQYDSEMGIINQSYFCDDNELKMFFDFIEKNRKHMDNFLYFKPEYVSKFNLLQKQFIDTNDLDFIKKKGTTLTDYMVKLKYKNGSNYINIGNNKGYIQLIEIDDNVL